MGKGRGPEQWHARVLREESERLTVAARILEARGGWFEGFEAGQQLGAGAA
ncbi:hypothetical protein VB1_CDS0067 [Arthrobacter phage Marchesin]|nr:hypothetical protein VB1_CDS0067 [Arthrobacter phage Marchesin]